MYRKLNKVTKSLDKIENTSKKKIENLIKRKKQRNLLRGERL